MPHANGKADYIEEIHQFKTPPNLEEEAKAISMQLIRESRELRTALTLTLHILRNRQKRLRKTP